MRRAVPVELQRFRTAVGDDADRRVLLDPAGEIDERAIDDRCKRGLARPGEISAAMSRRSYAGRHSTSRPVWKLTVTWFMRERLARASVSHCPATV
jgi:hypothetical protein